MEEKVRCFGGDSPLYCAYHDEEWGVPVQDDGRLFEMLILESAQAGLSWETVLRKRENYRRALQGFDPHKVAALQDGELEELLLDKGLIRNRKKIFSTRQNARVFLEIQKEYGSFASYLWKFVGGSPIINARKIWGEVPSFSEESTKLSRDLRKRGMCFVGPVVMYAFMQAVGLVNDHLEGCWCVQERKR